MHFYFVCVLGDFLGGIWDSRGGNPPGDSCPGSVTSCHTFLDSSQLKEDNTMTYFMDAGRPNSISNNAF